MTLSFVISSPDAFPNGSEFSDGDRCYAVIEEGEGGIWKAVSLERELPADLPDNRAALLGRLNYGLIEYGIEDFYIPETKRDAVAGDLEINRDKARVEIKIDSSGNAAIERLRIEDKTYE